MNIDENKFFAANEDIGCPRCRERLTPADVEDFNRCPYCDYLFEDDGELDDFIVSPAVRHYMSTANRKFPAI